VVVPVDFEDTVLLIAVTRNDKRAPCVAGIAANIRVPKPLIVIPRKTIEIDLYEYGYTPDTCRILFQEHGFLTREIFAEWAEAVVFPDMI
jgi:hypothetical protein